jgi:hypothetical protein
MRWTRCGRAARRCRRRGPPSPDAAATAKPSGCCSPPGLRSSASVLRRSRHCTAGDDCPGQHQGTAPAPARGCPGPGLRRTAGIGPARCRGVRHHHGLAGDRTADHLVRGRSPPAGDPAARPGRAAGAKPAPGHRVGPVVAGQVIISWSHRCRVRSEATFAKLAGAPRSRRPAAAWSVTGSAAPATGSSTVPCTQSC